MLTNETLRKIADEGGVLIGMNDVRPMAEELLTLRSMRDARDEEVDALAADFTIEECEQPCLTTWMQRNKKLRDIAIARGQKLREAQRKKHGYLNKNKPAVRASNLSLAVDAAMVANEKGVK